MFKNLNHQEGDAHITCRQRMSAREAILFHVECLQLFGLVIIIKFQISVAAALQPLQGDIVPPTDLSFQLGVRCANLCDCMIGGKTVLFKPGINVLFIFLQLADVFDGALQDSTFVLVAIWHKTGNLIDTLVDGFTPPTFH